MTELQAPTGRFILVEFERGIPAAQVTGLFRIISRLDGVAAACDLALVSMELLQERVLLQLDEADRRAWKRALKAS